MDTSILPQYNKNKNKRIGGIYQLRQLSTGRKYIGGSVDIRTRVLVHLRELRNQSHGNPRLQRAWNVSGENDFVIEILEIVADRLLVNKREQFYLDTAIDFSTDFNIIKVSGIDVSEARRGQPDPKTGKRLSAETRKKMSEAGKAAWAKRVISEESHKQRSESAKEMNRKRKESGWKLSDEGKKKQSELLKKIGHTPPLGWWKGKKRPPRAEEYKEKLREIGRNAWKIHRAKQDKEQMAMNFIDSSEQDNSA